jgi:thiol-disulfide isomerase/thioredoxin
VSLCICLKSLSPLANFYGVFLPTSNGAKHAYYKCLFDELLNFRGIQMKIRLNAVLAVLAAFVSLASVPVLAGPCAAKTSPCAAKTKVSPCAAKKTQASPAAATTGGPLAKELQGMPTVVDVYASWCPACKAIAPTLSSLKEEYKGKVNFVVLDVTDRPATNQAQATAQKLGLAKFLEANKSATGTVAVIDPATGEIISQFRGNTNKEDYVAGIQAVASRVKK